MALKRALDHEKHLLMRATSLEEIGNATHRTAGLLLHDVDGWRDIFAGKHLES